MRGGQSLPVSDCPGPRMHLLPLTRLLRIALSELLLIHLLKRVVSLVNDNHRIRRAKSLHKRQVLTPERKFNVDSVFLVLDCKGDVRDLDDIDVVVLLASVFGVLGRLLVRRELLAQVRLLRLVREGGLHWSWQVGN